MEGKETTSDRYDEEMPEDVEKFCPPKKKIRHSTNRKYFSPMPGKEEAGPRPPGTADAEIPPGRTGICVCEPQRKLKLRIES